MNKNKKRKCRLLKGSVKIIPSQNTFYAQRGEPVVCICAQHACCARSESSHRAFNDSDAISAINSSQPSITKMRFEPLDAQSDGSNRIQHACYAQVHITHPGFQIGPMCVISLVQ